MFFSLIKVKYAIIFKQNRSNLTAQANFYREQTHSQNPTNWAVTPRGRLDQNLPIGSAIFHLLGVFLTSCTCIVKSSKRGVFTKKWLWRGNLFDTFCGNFRGFL